ncbi:MAG: peptidoglycan-binding protein, partial [Acidimicrobiia bacterium]
MNRPRLLAAATAAVLAATGAASAAVTTIDRPADAPQVSAVRVDPPRPTIVIGDSAIAALRWVPGADNAVLGFDHTLDLESCRRLLAPSCRGREGRTPLTAYDALGVHGDRYEVLVVATGYNDGTSGYADAFRAIVSRARSLGYQQIVWWSLRSDVDYVSPGAVGNHETFARNNAVIEELLASGDYPDVELADWGGYTADRAEWFVTDGVHSRAVGAWAASDYLSRKMAHLEQRPCPMPTVPDGERQAPCPDPDETGPVADIEALYPIGEDGVLCYEIGDDREIECRYDTHVIQLTRELGPDDTGQDVSALQTRLVRLDHLDASATGFYGPQTEEAVRAFQAAEGLPVTGRADVATLDALGFDTSA